MSSLGLLLLGVLASALLYACTIDPPQATALRYDADLVDIPAGEAVVGDRHGDGRADEQPARRISIERPFQGRVLKGGAWTLPPELARISARDRTNQTARGMMIGFRVARDVVPAR
jgi:formylglycine-generating enzyme required for sulfatase activity